MSGLIVVASFCWQRGDLMDNAEYSRLLEIDLERYLTRNSGDGSDIKNG